MNYIYSWFKPVSTDTQQDEGSSCQGNRVTANEEKNLEEIAKSICEQAKILEKEKQRLEEKNKELKRLLDENTCLEKEVKKLEGLSEENQRLTSLVEKSKSFNEKKQRYSCIGKLTPFNKATTGFTCVLVITVIALSIILVTATLSASFNGGVQLGTTTNGILVGTSIFVFILDFVWIATLCKKTKEQSISQSEPSQLGFSKAESLQSALAPAVEEIYTNSFSLLSEEIIHKVFGFLSVIELTKCTKVSRKWRRIAFDKKLWNALDLRKISPLLKVFDKSDWDTHVDLSSFGLTMEGELYLDKPTAIPALMRLLFSLPIEGNVGVTLLTIPKGLTFNKLVKLAGSPKKGNTPKFKYIWDRILNELGDIPVDSTYRIVITNNVFADSRSNAFEDSQSLSISAQRALVNRFDCKLPSVLEAALLLVVTFMRSGERLYSDNPLTITRCSDQLTGYQCVVGGFSPDGISVNYSYYDSASEGAGGVLRLSTCCWELLPGSYKRPYYDSASEGPGGVLRKF